MSIVAYQTEEGKALWKAYACARSRKNRKVRVQKWKFNCETKEEALRAERNLLRECERELTERETKGSTWGAIVDSWEQFERSNPHLGQQARMDYYNLLQTYTADWMNRTAADILTVQIKEVLNQAESKGREKKFLATLKSTIDRIFRYGIDTRQIQGVSHSPGHGIKINQREKRPPEILNLEQVQDLLAKAKQESHPWYRIWAVALFTGMRAGELFALKWEDVNWETRHILVQSSYCFKLKREKSTKSGDWREVPISNQLAAILQELKGITGHISHVLPRLRDFAKGEQARVLRMFCEEYDLKSIKFHTLRACFATHMIQAGISQTQVMKIGGWKDLETLQIYVRLAGVETKGATEGLNFLPKGKEVLPQVA